jgi:hypothetical protein
MRINFLTCSEIHKSFILMGFGPIILFFQISVSMLAVPFQLQWNPHVMSLDLRFSYI